MREHGDRSRQEPDLERVAQLLDQVAAEEEATLAEARKLAGTRASAGLAAKLEMLAREAESAAEASSASAVGPAPDSHDGPPEGPPNGHSTSPAKNGHRSLTARRVSLALVAAAVLAFAYQLRDSFSYRGAGPGAERLSGTGFELVLPDERGASFAEFEWTFAAADDARFDLRISDPARPDSDNLLVHERQLAIPRWTPAPNQTETWPDLILIEVEALDRSGSLLDSLSISVSRSP